MSNKELNQAGSRIWLTVLLTLLMSNLGNTINAVRTRSWSVFIATLLVTGGAVTLSGVSGRLAARAYVLGQLGTGAYAVTLTAKARSQTGLSGEEARRQLSGS